MSAFFGLLVGFSAPISALIITEVESNGTATAAQEMGNEHELTTINGGIARDMTLRPRLTFDKIINIDS